MPTFVPIIRGGNKTIACLLCTVMLLGGCTRRRPLPAGETLTLENNIPGGYYDKVARLSMVCSKGPHIGRADINSDGLEDIFICGKSGQAGTMYLQLKDGTFALCNKALFDEDAACDDTDCVFFDADGDNDMDLYVCTGGTRYTTGNPVLFDRLYINDGNGGFTKSKQQLPVAVALMEDHTCVAAADYDADGDIDLFIGVHVSAFAYGYPRGGYMLRNNGDGVFVPVSGQACPLINTGMVTDAKWVDFDKDGRPDLIIAADHQPLKMLRNTGDGFAEEMLPGTQNSNGWWNTLVVTDINDDGYPDIIAGNHAMDNSLNEKVDDALIIHAAYFGQRIIVRQVLYTYNTGNEGPLAQEQLNNTVETRAGITLTGVLLNNKKRGFILTALPVETRLYTNE